VGLDVPDDELERRIRVRVDCMFAAGVAEEVARVLSGPVSVTAEKALGLREIGSLAPEEAREQLVVRTRRYAAYQRKWMRRIPGLVVVDADRPVARIVESVLTTARPARSTS
jgi:tRNA dimethylallyltransferase